MADREEFATAVGGLIKDRVFSPAAVTLDTDGTPYWGGPGTHRIDFDADGTPTYTAIVTPPAHLDTDGTPALTSPHARVYTADEVDALLATPPPAPPSDSLVVGRERLGPLLVNLSLAGTRTVPVVYLGSSTTARGALPAALTAMLAGAYNSTPAPAVIRALTELESATPGPGVVGYNAARGGTQVSDYLDDIIIENIQLVQPVAITHGVGSNDYGYRVDPEVYEAGLRDAIGRVDAVIEKPHVHIIFQQQAPTSVRTHPWSAYTDAMRRVAASIPNGVFVDLGPSIDPLDPLTTDPYGIGLGDGAHLSDDGERALAELLLHALRIPGPRTFTT